LSGDEGITVEPVGPQKQWVSLKEPTEWHWQVTATREGERRLVLEFFALLNVAGESNPRLIRTLSKTINVQVESGVLTKITDAAQSPETSIPAVGVLVLV